MAKPIKPDQLSEALGETLELYGKGVRERVNEAGRSAMDRLVRMTRSTAPKGKRRKHYRNSITSAEETNAVGTKKYIWYVKSPNHRLTHLLVHGHVTKDGGRTKANPFLHNAIDTVFPDYEKAIEEAVKSD